MLKLQAIGYLGRDAQVNEVNGHHVINFTLAHTERWKSEGQVKEKTIWLDCAYWTAQIQLAEMLKKGTQVYVEGLPDSRAFVNQQHEAASTLTVRISQLTVLHQRQEETAGSRISAGERPSHFSNMQNGKSSGVRNLENPVAAAARRMTNPLA